MRPYIEADLKGIRLMWIPGWRIDAFRAWLRALSNNPVKEWWAERPWKPRRKNV